MTNDLAAPAARTGFNVLAKVAPPGERPHLATTRDISMSGMLVEAPITLEVGMRVEIQLFLPGSRTPLELKGEVTRVAGGTDTGQLYGTKFVETKAEAVAELERFLAGRQRRTGGVAS